MNFNILLVAAACASAVSHAGPAQGSCVVIRTATATASDSAAAMATCQTAAARFTLLTGTPAPAGTVLLGTSDVMSMAGKREHWTLRWPSAVQRLRVASLLGYSGDQARSYASNADRSVLPHEIGHAQIEARCAGVAHELPPWFNEATAMWMEPADLQRHRLQQAEDSVETAPPLDAVLRFKHPQVDLAHTAFSRTELTGQCRGVCGAGRGWKTRLILRRVRDDGTASSDTLYDEAVMANIAHADTVTRYYNYSLAVLYYVRARGGVPALRTLAARLVSDSAGPDPLANIAGLPSSAAAREEDWRRWLRSASQTLQLDH